MREEKYLKQKKRPLNNTAYDTFTCAQHIPSDAENRFLVIGKGYYDPADFDWDAIVKAW